MRTITSPGFAAASDSYDRFQPSSVPGRKFSTTISARAASARDRLAVRRAQVHGRRALVARLHVPPERRAVLDEAPLAQRITDSRRLDLDDVGAEFGEDLRAEGTGDQRAHFEDADPCKRAARCRRWSHVPASWRSIDERRL
jgi:hypothetical protein